MKILAILVLCCAVACAKGLPPITNVAAGATIGISLLEAPDTWRKFKRAVKMARHPKRKETK